MNNVLVVWKSTRGAGSTRLVESLKVAAGERARVAHLELDVTPRVAEATGRGKGRDGELTEALGAAARAVAGLHDLVLVELSGAAALPATMQEPSQALAAIAELTRAGAHTVLVCDISSYSVAVGLSRLAEMAFDNPHLDTERVSVLLNRADDRSDTSRVEHHLTRIGVNGLHLARSEATRHLRAARGSEAGGADATSPVDGRIPSLAAVAYDILCDMDLPCLAVTEKTFASLLGAA